jgi:outer membrane autotransporter protein
MDVLNVVTGHAEDARLAMNAEERGISTGESASGFSSWGEAYGGAGHQDGQGQFGGYTLTSEGLVAGGDLPVADSGVRVGGVFTFTNAGLHDQGDRTGDSTGLNAYGLLGYGTYLGSRAYADVVAGVMFDRFDTRRVVDFTGVSGAADGSHNGVQYVARADGGIPFNFGVPKTPTTLAPVWGLTVSHLDQSGYTETGDREIALNVRSEASTSVKGEAGFKLEHSFETSLGMVVPELRAVYRHEFDNSLQFQTSSFAADETNSVFGTQSMQPNVNSMVYSVGGTLLGDRDVAVTVKYEVETANGFLNQTGSLRIRWAF